MPANKEYASSVLSLIEKKLVRGIAHITGGGFEGNIPRILPEGLGAEIKKSSFEVLPIFKLMQKLGNVSEKDMFRTFNMGIGMVLVVSKEIDDYVVKQIQQKETANIIGRVTKGSGVIYVD